MKELKFQYAYYVAIVYQSTDLEEVGKTLTEELITLNNYLLK